MSRVGISDIALYVPPAVIAVESIAAMRTRERPELACHLERAVTTTGQKAVRFPTAWEDTSTMAAEAAQELLLANPHLELSGIRYLAVGTETSVDHAKPASAYVQGMLVQAGFPLPSSLSSFQVQHACAGGTVGLLSVAALLDCGGRRGESGIVICSDIARYDSHTTAEVTQGAGAAALLVERSARLVELDLGTAGFCSKDVDDFFRPLGADTARVKGSYSIKCYSESLEGAFRDHCRRRGEDPASVLESTDLLVLHTPFHNLPELVMLRLLGHVMGLGGEAARDFLRQRGLPASVAPVAGVGNTYTASIYLCLASLLADRHRQVGEGIVGMTVLMASYGSGNTMVVTRGRVAAQAPEVIGRWRLGQRLRTTRAESVDEYVRWMQRSDADGHDSRNSQPGGYYLEGIRSDGYRQYGFKPSGRGASERPQADPVARSAVEVRRS